MLSLKTEAVKIRYEIKGRKLFNFFLHNSRSPLLVLRTTYQKKAIILFGECFQAYRGKTGEPRHNSSCVFDCLAFV